MAGEFKFRVYVSLKRSVLDPQGVTILEALRHMNFSEAKSCRAGKFFDLEIKAASRAEAEAKLEQAAKDILSNPVIEDYSITLL